MGVSDRAISGVLGLLLGGAALFPTEVRAFQAAPPAPPQAQPSVPTREQIEQRRQQEAPPRPRASVDTRRAIVQTPCALEDSPLKVTLTSVTFQRPDGTPIHPELQQLLSSVGTGPAGEQSIAVVCRIRDQANQLLEDAGYVALAQILAQEIAGGQLKVTIVTARIVEVRVLGDGGPFQKGIERRIEAIRALDPLNRRDAERILLMTGDVPGVDVQLSLRSAGTRPGEVIGELSVETSRSQVLAKVQNYGSVQLGPVIASVQADAYGLTGLSDRTSIAYSNSTDFDEIRVLQGGHDFALNDRGLRAGLRGSLAFSNPDIDDLDLRSRSSIVGVELSQLLIRTLAEQLGVGVGFEAVEQRTRIHQGSSPIPFTRDRLRIAYARLDGRIGTALGSAGQAAAVTGYAEARKGLDILGASEIGVTQGGFAPSRFEGNPEAWVLRSELVADVRPFPALAIGAQLFGQWANDPLLNLEEFSIGNFSYGRGYDPGSNGGDRALAFRIEPSLRLPLTPESMSLWVLGFYDHIKLYNLDTGSTERERRIRSIGGGLRMLQSRRFVLDLLYARPLDRVLATEESRPKERFLASFTIQLQPWGVR